MAGTLKDVLAIVMPFRAPEPAAPAASKVELKIEVPWYNKILTSGPLAWYDRGIRAVGIDPSKANTLDKITQTATDLTKATSTGLKWGLILAGGLLAVYIIAQFKNASR